jgi:hypothetical protein
MHTAKPLVPELTSFKVKIAIENLKRCRSPGTEQTLAELIQTVCNRRGSDVHRIITSVRNEEELPRQCKESIVVPLYKMDDKTVVIIEKCHSYQPHTKLYPVFSPKENSKRN